MQPTDLVTIGEAARRLGVSVDTVRRWSEDGVLAAVRTVGGHRRFVLADVEALSAPAPEEATA